VDQRFPGSKFILTVRDSPEQWYASLARSHAALFGKGRLPTTEEMKAFEYVWPGWAYDAMRLVHGAPDDDLYRKETLVANYATHNQAVIKYFRYRPGDLLVLNVADPDAYDRLCRFLGKPCTGREFPWQNRSADIEKKKSSDGSQPQGLSEEE
jgi:hypothetical protein